MAALLLVFGLLLTSCASQQEEEPRSEGPGARYGHELVYDESANRLVLFGGFHDDGVPLGDTWVRRDDTWSLLAEQGTVSSQVAGDGLRRGARPPRPVRGRSGTGQSGESLGDTWVLEGADWRELEGSGPPARDHHRMVYDRSGDRMVLFGGWDGEQLLDDTWVWDGESWTQLQSTGPSARAPFGLAYDESNEQVVLFGGKTLDEFFDDTWVLDAEGWSPVAVDGPSPRSFHALTFDTVREEVLLFSGRYGDSLLTDTWTWNGSRWQDLGVTGPTKRGIYALAFDRSRGEAVFYGSGLRQDGSWVLDAETWIWKGDAWQHEAR